MCLVATACHLVRSLGGRFLNHRLGPRGGHGQFVTRLWPLIEVHRSASHHQLKRASCFLSGVFRNGATVGFRSAERAFFRS